MNNNRKLAKKITEFRAPMPSERYRAALTPEAASASASLIGAFAIAADALVEIQSNLDRHGLDIALTSDNFTTMGLSLYIAESKKTGIR